MYDLEQHFVWGLKTRPVEDASSNPMYVVDWDDIVSVSTKHISSNSQKCVPIITPCTLHATLSKLLSHLQGVINPNHRVFDVSSVLLDTPVVLNTVVATSRKDFMLSFLAPSRTLTLSPDLLALSSILSLP